MHWSGKGQLVILEILKLVCNDVVHRLEQVLHTLTSCSATSLRNAAAKIALSALSYLNWEEQAARN